MQINSFSLVLKILSFCSLTAISQLSIAQNQCDQINCDCAALEIESLVKQCQQTEQQLLKDCFANKQKLDNYCAWHGPNAFPTALTLNRKLENEEFFVNTDTPMRLKALFDTMKLEFQISRVALGHNYTTLTSRGVGAAYLELKQAYALQMASHENDHKARPGEHWTEYEKYLTDVLTQATALEKSLWKKAKDKSDHSDTWEILALRQSINTSALLEQLAVAKEINGTPTEAAEQWQEAARHTEKAIESVPKLGKRIDEYFYTKAGHDWYRSAWHRLKSDDKKNALTAEIYGARFLESANKTAGKSSPSRGTASQATQTATVDSARKEL